MILSEWAAAWGIPPAALADLQSRLVGLDWDVQATDTGTSEAAVQTRARLQASREGMRMWRNNVGAAEINGSWLRFGLANDSPAVNAKIKSGDLIGIRPRVIQPGDVGKLIGQFCSWECKHVGWKFTGTPREVAQQNWAALVTSLGGEARFVY